MLVSPVSSIYIASWQAAAIVGMTRLIVATCNNPAPVLKAARAVMVIEPGISALPPMTRPLP